MRILKCIGNITAKSLLSPDDCFITKLIAPEIKWKTIEKLGAGCNVELVGLRAMGNNRIEFLSALSTRIENSLNISVGTYQHGTRYAVRILPH